MTGSSKAFVDVFIEGTFDSSPDAVRRGTASLARCLAISELRARALLGAGRVRVRSNLQFEFAEQLVRLLEKAGIRTSLSPFKAQQVGSGSGIDSSDAKRTSIGVRSSGAEDKEESRTQVDDDGGDTEVFARDAERSKTPLLPYALDEPTSPRRR